ncbi:amino acid adenylation domain-containing protein [Nonomuraea typhae]|uniref:Amino acid adenylation domain-containing protein n=1 Tax=Nonomuraea typhae TaxID=2603600 RepID=A0ABW7Z9I3_9ACTN
MTAQEHRTRDALAEVMAARGAELADPLSAGQRRWWLLSQLGGDDPAVVVASYRIDGPLEPAAAQLRLSRLLQAQEAPRSVFTEAGGLPARLVLPLAEPSVRVVDLMGAGDPAGEARVLTRVLAAEPFDVGAGPLFRVLLMRLGCDRWELCAAGHRLVADATSLDLVAAAMAGDATGGPAVPALPDGRQRDAPASAEVLRADAPPPKEAPRADAPAQTEGPRADVPALSEVLRREREEARRPGAAEAVVARGAQLAPPAATEIPPAGARPAVKRHDRGSEVVRLDRELAGGAVRVRDWREYLVAAWLIVLARHQPAHEDAQCAVRLPRPAGLGGVLGPLDELRLVRVRAGDGDTVGDVLAGVRAELAGPAVPYARLVEVCPPARDLSRTPYAQTVIRAVDAREPVARSGVTAVHAIPSGAGTAEQDVEITVWLGLDEPVMQVDYDAALYDAPTARGLADRLATTLRAILPGGAGDRADSSARDLELTGAVSLPEQPAAGRGQRVDGSGGSLLELVAEQVRRRPGQPAIRFGAAEVSYAELWRRAVRIGAVLRARGVRPGALVAVWLRRSPDVVAAQLGVLCAGAAFVPVDAGHPAGRVRYLLADSGAALVLTETAVDVHGDLGVPSVRLGDLPDPAQQDPVPVDGDAPAYLIYTSGSTGRPKGVLLRHSGAVNNVRWRQRTWPLGPDDRVLHNHAVGFDPSIWAVFWPLSAGATIVLAAEEQMEDPDALITLLREHGVSVVGGVPALLGLLLEHPDAGTCTKVRLLLSGAEPLDRAVVERAAGVWSAEAANLYGPTETTIDATFHRVRPGEGPVPIGAAIDNVRIHVVDRDLRRVPPLVPGELLIGGDGVALGYHRRPGLTAARFLPDPYGERPGGRLYRTGDLVRMLPGGDLEFLGRIDDQVKIRGHRVEPREIESILAGELGLRAAVLALEAGTEHARLAAAVVAGGDRHTAASVRALLAARLPGYLVPDRIELVEALPRTRNGKLDRRALAERLAAGTADDGPDAPAEPRTGLERSVARAFCEVLRVRRLDVHADFFAAGGTSMLLARLATVLRTRHAVDIPLHEFFRVPTIAGVAETIDVYSRSGLEGVLGRHHASMLEADGTLDDGIRPDGLPPADWSDPRRVLLTGATGYLGLHLLEELLRRTDATVVALCRGEDPAHAMNRIREGLATYAIDLGEELLDRVECVIGDLGRPRLGLDGPTWERLAREVDVIYHNGALVNFVYPYSALKAPNVGGTQQVLALACTARLKAVHHVSTIDTLLATHTPRPFPEDDTPLRSAVNVPAGYTGSKWVAEKVMDAARRRGIPVTVFRPGLILGHTRTGATQPTDYLLIAFRGFLELGVLPDYPRIFDVVPVDYVAAAIVHVSRQRAALGGYYNLFNPAPVPLRRFCDWLAEYGYRFDVVPFEEGRRRALQVGPGHPLYPIVPLIRDADPEPHRALDPRFMHEVEPARETAGTLRFLAGSGVFCPPASAEDARRVADYLVGVGFLPPPDAASAPGGRKAKGPEEKGR